MKRITALLAAAALLTVLLCSCSLGDVINTESLTDDPATEFVDVVLGKTVKTEKLRSGSFTYTEFTDSTVAITAYDGNDAVLAIPAEINGLEVVALENKALYKNDLIEELVLPDSVRAVGNFAVMYCDSLKKVVFGKGIENIGIGAFQSSNRDSFTGSGSLETLVFNGAPKVIDEKAFYFCDKLTEIVLPSGVETIGEWAFAKCFSAKRIVLGDGLIQIENHAFLKCRNAREVSIPGSCKTIGTSAFYQCISLAELTLGEGVEKLEKGAFEECTALREVTLPQSLATIGKYAFYNCTSLESVTAFEGIEAIEDDVFENAGSLVITAPQGSVIAEYARDNSIKTA